MINTILRLIVLAAMLVPAAFPAKPGSCEIPVTFEIKESDSNGANCGIQSDGLGLYDDVIYCSGDATLNLRISHYRKVTAQFGVALDPGDPPYTDAETVQAWLQVRNVLWNYDASTDYTTKKTCGSTPNGGRQITGGLLVSLGIAVWDLAHRQLGPCVTPEIGL